MSTSCSQGVKGSQHQNGGGKELKFKSGPLPACNIKGKDLDGPTTVLKKRGGGGGGGGGLRQYQALGEGREGGRFFVHKFQSFVKETRTLP